MWAVAADSALIGWRTPRSRGSRSGTAVLTALAFSLPSVSAASQPLERPVVRVTVAHREGVEIGSGVVLCQDGPRAYVITAKHVVRGVGAVDQFNQPTGKPFRGVSRIEVAFAGDRPAAIAGDPDAFLVNVAERKDIALLSFDAPVGALTAARPGSSAAVGPGNPVRTCGYSSSAARGWMHVVGHVADRGEFIRYAPAIHGGFSGGPVYAADDSLIAINTQAERDLFSVAVPIDEVLWAFASELPEVCRPGVITQAVRMARDDLQMTYVAVRAARVRPEPALMAESMETLAPGTQVMVTGIVDDAWLRITRPRGGTGYVRSKDLALRKERDLAPRHSATNIDALNLAPGSRRR